MLPRTPRLKTDVGFVILGWLCALAFILYLDRVCMGRQSAIQDEMNLTNTQMTVLMVSRWRMAS